MNVDTQTHLTILRGMLVFQLNEARSELRGLQQDNAALLTDAPLREPTDRKEEAAAGQEFEVADAAIERLGREVAQCERALQRMDQERYGDCVDCGEPIAWARLMAQPSADRCADCQHAFESPSPGTARA
jgi:RNA polymerase-binding transcription factor DksA